MSGLKSFFKDIINVIYRLYDMVIVYPFGIYIINFDD